MFVNVSTDGVVLRQADDFVRFHIVAPPGTDSAELDQLLRAAGAGSAQECRALVDSAWLRAAGDGSDAWTRGLDGMLGYARSKGWMHGDAVAAHVETGE
ncbi:MAG: hypothetical protein JWL97_4479 [Gemmatimonadales bacterium]|nr:hypothetical protein [Gemmatimonadales bacterium]